MDAATIETISSREACDLADVSYRQVDYWTRIGLVRPDTPARGSGSRRRWTLQDAVVLRVVHRLMVLRVPHLVIRDAIAVLDSNPDLLWVRGREVSAGDAFDFMADLADLGADETVTVIAPAAFRAEVERLHNRG